MCKIYRQLCELRAAVRIRLHLVAEQGLHRIGSDQTSGSLALIFAIGQ